MSSNKDKKQINNPAAEYLLTEPLAGGSRHYLNTMPSMFSIDNIFIDRITNETGYKD
jgi:hypothetical protein